MNLTITRVIYPILAIIGLIELVAFFWLWNHGARIMLLESSFFERMDRWEERLYEFEREFGTENDKLHYPYGKSGIRRYKK